MRTRQTRRRRKQIPYALRLLLMGGAAVLTAYVSVLLVIKVAAPYRLAHQQSSEIRRIETEINKQKRENIVLKKQIAVSNSAEGMEKAAREKGYARPDEHVFQFAPPEMRSALPPAATTPARPKNRALRAARRSTDTGETPLCPLILV